MIYKKHSADTTGELFIIIIIIIVKHMHVLCSEKS